MRSLLAVVLSFMVFVSTSIAQAGKQNPPAGPDWMADWLAAKQEEPKLPTALYECDNHQCQDPNSGGAVWLFEGKEGQGAWLYPAVTKLTVVSFDGSTIRIHREDPVGTYSSQFAQAQGGAFTADYEGTITGNTIKGSVHWNGGEKADYWSATIVNRDFCTERAPRCPLRPDQLSVLGRRAAGAKMYASAFRCFELAAAQNDADGEGFEAQMMMNGWGGKHNPSEIMDLLQDSADRDSYAGEKGLARAYEEGVIVAKNAKRAAYWDDRAPARQAKLEEQERSQQNSQLAGKVMGQWLVVALLVAAMAGDNSQGQGDAYRNLNKQREMGRMACNLTPSNCH
jgi:hypothetical protein